MLRKLLHMGPLIALACALSAQVALAPPPPPVLPITIALIRHLDMGDCMNNPGTNYVVVAAELPGASACPGAQSGRFEVSGDANARVTVDLPGTTFTVNNGGAALTLTSDADPLQGNISLDGSGMLTIWVGASYKIPPGGVTTPGVYTGSSTLTVDYK
ncbi:MAG: DUF4402 domain-containing protein [Candidatus Lambdaproteobacteria bacterium]|nr:DUF4402 domain-containing protein [Candidatus Lambdaproteobacteria bacterium]